MIHDRNIKGDNRYEQLFRRRSRCAVKNAYRRRLIENTLLLMAAISPYCHCLPTRMRCGTKKRLVDPQKRPETRYSRGNCPNRKLTRSCSFVAVGERDLVGYRTIIILIREWREPKGLEIVDEIADCEQNVQADERSDFRWWFSSLILGRRSFDGATKRANRIRSCARDSLPVFIFITEIPQSTTMSANVFRNLVVWRSLAIFPPLS